MTGIEYENFVKAVLIKELNLPPKNLFSLKKPGVIFPGEKEVLHQIDLFYKTDNGFAEYLTIIECKYRSSNKIDQKIVQNFAFVKSSTKASKAIIVSNQSFTSGALALAKSEKIALLQIIPDESLLDYTFSIEGDNEYWRLYLNNFDKNPEGYHLEIVKKSATEDTGDFDFEF